MQITRHQTVHRLPTALLFGVGLFAFILLTNLGAKSAQFLEYFVPPVHAKFEFDYSADDIDYRNNRLPPPYVPAGHTLLEKYTQKKTGKSLDIWSELRDGFKLEKFDSKLVKRHEDRFTRNPKQFEKLLERARPYLPFILEQVQHYNMPAEVALLPLIESNFNPRAYSSRGAAGLWQFMPATGRHYGLTQTWWYEGRRDITYSTEAALRHLRELNDIFDGDWSLSFAAYNAGRYRILRAIRANQKLNKPTDLKSLKLNSETRNYYPKLMAAKNIILNPGAFGVELPKILNESPFKIVEFEFQVDLYVLSEVISVDTLQLALLNPGLRRRATPPTGPFRVLVPKDKFEEVLAWKRDLHPVEAIPSVVHIVRAGDTLGDISERFGVSIASLKRLNSKNSDLIRIGEEIRIPPHRASSGTLAEFNGSDIVHKVVSGDVLSRIAQAYGVSLSDLRSINRIDRNSDLIFIGQEIRIPSSQSVANNNSNVTASSVDLKTRTLHTVVKGESLWSIARKYSVKILDIINWNKISRSSHIYPGQKLVLFVY